LVTLCELGHNRIEGIWPDRREQIRVNLRVTKPILACENPAGNSQITKALIGSKNRQICIHISNNLVDDAKTVPLYTAIPICYGKHNCAEALPAMIFERICRCRAISSALQARLL
jgi:hypothetical protein